MELTAHPNSFGHPRPGPREALRLPSTRPLAEHVLRGILTRARIRGAEQDAAFSALVARLLVDGLSDAEDGARSLLVEKLQLGHSFNSLLQERAARIHQQIRHWVEGRSVLDFGCGDGRIGQLLQQEGFDVLLTDLIDSRASGVSTRFVSRADLSRSTKPFEFDTALILTVLHHCDDPEAELRTVRSLCSKRIVVIESTFGVTASQPDGIASMSLALERDFRMCAASDQLAFVAFLDWFYNRVLHHGVPCPLNFNNPPGWRSTFASHGLSIVTEASLGMDQPLVPEYHILYVLEPMLGGSA